ncbi:MAG TPA: amino acid adenylation domain-containing protein, partial [Polyangiaceae bacterium]
LGSGSVPAVQVPEMVWRPAVLSADGAVDGAPKFDLGLSMMELGDAFLCKLEFDPTLFALDAVERFADHFRLFLTHAIAAPETRIGDVEILGAAEQELLLTSWNATRAPFPQDLCAHQLFEAQAARTPDAVALQIGDAQLRFAELNRRANQLAHLLRRRGVGPETLCGLLLDRSFEMAVAILGVLKAGGAYVPLDPSYPAKRLAFMREDARLEVTLTHTKWRGLAGEGDLFLDALAESLATEPVTDPARVAGPESLVYVIYTSGSTGRPKGVLVTHRGLVNYLTWAVEAYEVARGSGAPVHSSLSFDLTVTSLWLPWLAGRRAVLLPDAPGIEALERALSTHEHFSLVKLTPAHLDVLHRRFADGDATGSARALVVGGEALTAETFAGWQRASRDTEVIVNEYGPTETVVGCCVYFAKRGEVFHGSVPIGRPIANTQLFVLDGRQRLLPIGLPGELYIGGAGVARGYLHRPELTAERFIDSPYSKEPGARLYRTGDLVRYRGDGVLEFLGRIDDQVKVRGHRVELGEIESALLTHPGVSQCAVSLRQDAPGDKRLVAYVVASPGGAPLVGALRDHLKTTLPDPMIPAVFVILDALPLTANGKIDRAALPAPEGLRPELQSAFAPPSNATEETLALIWAEVLRLDRVGIRDNFFEIGGDSILSIQVVNRARKAGLRLTPAQLFQSQTVAELARSAEVMGAPSAEEGPAQGEASLTPIQRWFFEREQPHPEHFNQAILLRLRAGIDPQRLERALSRSLASHDALRLRFTREPGGWRQRYTAEAAPFALARWDLSALEDEVLDAEIARRGAELQGSLSLDAGPLARAAWIDTGTRGVRLLIAIHHLV